MNELRTLADVVSSEALMKANEVHVDPDIGRQAMIPLQRMLDFKY